MGDCVGMNDSIWTLSANVESSNTPILLLHGFASGLGSYSTNIEAIAENRPLYVIDLLGHGRSSRPTFSDDKIAQQFVQSIEKWRETMKIPKFILSGLSLGGYIASLYALEHPDNIEHLILSEPYAMTDSQDYSKLTLSQKMFLTTFQTINPLAFLRAFGPYRELLFSASRCKLIKSFKTANDDHESFVKYMIQVNSNPEATGEMALWKLVRNISNVVIGEKFQASLSPDIPLTFLNGETTWLNTSYQIDIKESRPNSFTNIVTIKNVEHDLPIGNNREFNQAVNEACKTLKTQEG